LRGGIGLDKSIQYRVGVDIGGTFTDIVLLGTDGSITTKKVSSTPEDYGKGIIIGLMEILQNLNLLPTAIEGVVHATTVATNAILEGKGAKTALITTEGFRDVLEFRRTRIPELYNLFYDKPPPLVPRRLRLEVEERIGPKGEIRKPLNEHSVRTALGRIKDAEVQALAICLLHSYANPQHERIVAKIARDVLPNVYITSSVDILPEIREYERTSTTVINAYVGPIVEKYLSSLLKQLRSIGINARLQVTQSAGGVMTAESAMKKPAHIIDSGPAAGVIAASRVAKLVGYPNVLTLDMGGTTAKAAMIENGEVTKTSEYEVGAGINISSQLVKGGGYALRLPFVDVSEIGAGGGSIVSIGKGGLLQVGPHSAGAMPGPVCYDLGGEEPTFTDAVVTLGYINPGYLAGGKVRLNAEKGKRVLEAKIARPLQKSLIETAYGIYTIACAIMMRAVKAVSTYRGRDPRDFALFAFGGNGPVAAVEIAKSLQMKRVVVPPSPGVFSALGLLFSNIEHEFVQTYLRRSKDVSSVELNDIYAKLEQQAESVLLGEGFALEQVTVKRYADLRYSGQTYELTIPVKEGLLGPAELPDMLEAFGQEHLRTYGHRATYDPVDIVNLRVVGKVTFSDTRTYDPSASIQIGGRIVTPNPSERKAFFGPDHGLLNTSVFARQDLTNQKIMGPLIIEEYDATCVIPPGCEASLDDWGNIVIDIG
jgi:N-methylhydantoinase A